MNTTHYTSTSVEDIKVGEIYNIRMKVTAKDEHHFLCRPLLCGDIISDSSSIFFTSADAVAFHKPYPVPEQPKYDPCRLFREGDIVEIDTHGRDIAASMKREGVELGKRYTVTEDESKAGYVSFKGDDGIKHNSIFFWLKLVLPVEEQEPYYIEEELGTITVLSKKDPIFHKCWHYGGVKSGVIALATAEDERDRLNAKHRKEKENA